MERQDCSRIHQLVLTEWLQALNVSPAHHLRVQMGMIWVGVSDLPGNNWSGGARSDLNRLGAWVGAMGQSNADEDNPSIGDIDTAERFGARVALIARRFKDGTTFLTDRTSEAQFRRENISRREALSGRKG